MGYCNIKHIENIIAQTLTTANSTSLDEFQNMLPLVSLSSNIGGDVNDTLNKNVISVEMVNNYISLADQEIDAELSMLYSVPFKRIVDSENVIKNINSDNQIQLTTVAPIQPGDVLKIIVNSTISSDIYEYVVSEVVSPDTIEVSEVLDTEIPIGSRISRVSYPGPIVAISARKSAAYLYDKYFSGENAPNQTLYGQELRKIVQGHINSILTGQIILKGQHRIGRRFYNSTLVDQYGLRDIGNLPSIG